MINPFLIGERVYLRPLELDDAKVLTLWFNDPDVTKNLIAYYRPISVSQEEDWLAARNKGEDVAVGIALRETDELIGSAGLHKLDQRSRQAAFGIVIGRKDLWSKGIGTQVTRLLVDYAFSTLNLHRVWLHVHEPNTRAIRAYEKVGFQREGVLRDECFRDGRYGNTITMAILRPNWEARRQAAGG